MDTHKLGWQPNLEYQKEVREDIEDAFQYGRKRSLTDPEADSVQSVKPDEEFIAACSKVGAFLMEREAFIKQLKKLNQLIVQKSKGDTHPTTVKELLRKTLEEELGGLGFKPEFGKALTFVSPEDFRATIADGLLLKDVALGGQPHGEFTHAIQWLMIAWQQKETNFIGCPAVDIFKRLGQEESVFQRFSEHSEKGIWDLLVDSTLTYGYIGFRSPENLNRFILETKDSDLAFLRKLITSRQKKREAGAFIKLEPHKQYHQGKLPGVHEPKGSEIPEGKRFKK